MEKILPHIDESELIKDYKTSTLTNTELYEKYQISEKKLYRILKNKNIPVGREHFTRHNWTLEEMQSSAKRYQHRSDWQTGDRKAYSMALKRGLLELCCNHMTPKPSCFTADIGVIYSFEFSDNSVYVGLTVVPHKRYQKHMNEGSVCNHIKICPDFKYNILEQNVAFEDLPNREEHHLQIYKANGYKILNKVKTGSRGSIATKYWSINKIQEDALKYKTRTEWARKSPKSYNAAVKMKAVDSFCKHMELKRQTWDDDKVKEDAKKYFTKVSWSKNSGSAYNYAITHKMVDVCCEHMVPFYKSWTDEAIINDAKKYNSISEWSSASSAYVAALKRGIGDIATSHMDKSNYIRWKDEDLIADAAKYQNRSDWLKYSRKFYMAAGQRKILHLCIHGDVDNSNLVSIE